jgi:AraC family transcriptional regulator
MVRIAALLEYVRTHLDADLNVAVLAERAGFSPFHFQRIFRVALGETIGDYVRRARLQRAAIRLREAGEPITEIALESGYETPSAFARAFASVYGQSPSAFRAAGASPVMGYAMELRVERIEPIRVLGMIHHGPYSQVPALWRRFLDHLDTRALLAARPQMIGLSYGDPDTEAQEALWYAACVATEADADESLETFHIGAGRFVAFRHRGSYQLIGHAFDIFDQVLFHERLELRDVPCMEFYRSDVASTAADELVTDLYIPVV